MFQRLVSFGSWFLFFAMIEHLGEEEMAISGIVRSVYMLCTLSVFAFGTTANTVTSRLIGAGKPTRFPRPCVASSRCRCSSCFPYWSSSSSSRNR